MEGDLKTTSESSTEVASPAKISVTARLAGIILIGAKSAFNKSEDFIPVCLSFLIVAAREGFEPPRVRTLPDFESGAFSQTQPPRHDVLFVTYIVSYFPSFATNNKFL